MTESLRDALERVRRQLRDSEDGGIEAAAYAEAQAARFIEANYDALLAAVRDGERWQAYVAGRTK